LIKSNPHLLVLSYNISYYLLRGFVYWCHGLVDHAVCGNHASQSSHHYNSCITLIPYFIFEMKQIIKHWFCPSICGSGRASVRVKFSWIQSLLHYWWEFDETRPQCLAFWMPFCAWSPEFTVTIVLFNSYGPCFKAPGVFHHILWHALVL